jgi:hypothetical protein
MRACKLTVFESTIVLSKSSEKIAKMIRQYTYKRKLSYVIAVFMLVLQIRCTPRTLPLDIETTQVVTPASMNRETATPTLAPTVIHQPTILSTPTPNGVIILPEAVTTPTVVASTVLPTATLVNEQKAKNLTTLLETNSGCELPCWWGINPGEATFETVRSSFEPQGFWVEDNWLGGGTSHAITIEFELESGVVQSMRISDSYAKGIQDANAFIRDWERYSLDKVLSRYGLPTRVQVYYPFRPDPGSEPAYHLFIFYEELGIEIDYLGNATDVDGEKSRACPQLDEVFTINLFLYQSGEISNILETVIPSDSISFIAGPETVYDLISWEQATDTTLESFYETFSQPDSEACFEFRRYWTSPGE